MPTIPTMRLLFILLLLAPGCKDEIGDSCSVASDCSQDGDRICDNTQHNGYCTVLGCDYDTCPDESVCVRFYSVGDTGVPCDNATEDVSTDDCGSSERCALGGFCVPVASETRYCMRKCSGDGGCRDRYECRTEELMIAHGGEPVPTPGDDQSLKSFCAEAP